MLSDYWRQKCSFSTLTFSTFLPPPLVHLSSRGCPFEKKKYWDCCRYRCRRKKLLHKISQVFPSIPKYSQVYLNIPLFHPQEDPSRMELSLGQPDKEKIAKTAWEGNSTIICSDFEQSLCWSNLCPRRSSSPLLVTTLLISGWEIRLLGVFTGQEDLLR